MFLIDVKIYQIIEYSSGTMAALIWYRKSSH
jgi:hypothetical protein